MFLNRILILLFLATSSIFFSQSNVVEKDTLQVNPLDKVILTATGTIRQLSSAPMLATLISKKNQKIVTTRLTSILLEQTGNNFVTDQSGFTSIQTQGLYAAYVMIIIDGVPLIRKSSGNLDLNRITVNNIKQIEIVKGPSSYLYGSEAIGGVIISLQKN